MGQIINSPMSVCVCVSVCHLYGRNSHSILIRVAPNFGFGFGKFEIRPFFSKFGQIRLRPNLWPNLADANATAVRSVSYLITNEADFSSDVFAIFIFFTCE